MVRGMTHATVGGGRPLAKVLVTAAVIVAAVIVAAVMGTAVIVAAVMGAAAEEGIESQPNAECGRRCVGFSGSIFRSEFGMLKPDMPEASRFQNPEPIPSDQHGLAIALEPTLRQACDGRLSDVGWFHSGWQHSGAETGFATWTMRDGRRVDVVIKLPISPNELRWTSLLGGVREEEFDAPQHRDLPVPRVFRSGDQLGSYDLAWMVVERLPGKTLASNLGEASVRSLIVGLHRFHEAARRRRPVSGQPTREDWDALLQKSRESLHEHQELPEVQRWNEAVKKVQRHVPSLVSRWEGRTICTWCHGDFHPGNAMRRSGDGASCDANEGCVLVDLALMHAGHWIEDAVYLERLYWGKPELLHGVRPVAMLAKLRRDHGLHNDEDYPKLAAARRVLMAATAPAFMQTEGHPRYLHAALEVMEQQLALAVG
ncbi:MAG: aminoglycoside phosphotransferase family protein [Planctomycetota bacterium]|nr:aminoglycoside phosphotransferase family protein [Planctomycetota bacterium]